MLEVPISQIIWHLRGLQGVSDEWRFAANYKLELENATLRNRLQGETDPALSNRRAPRY